jgi:predicted O-linked N-acetylglucosamine transferase (SPINDLY family)
MKKLRSMSKLNGVAKSSGKPAEKNQKRRSAKAHLPKERGRDLPGEAGLPRTAKPDTFAERALAAALDAHLHGDLALAERLYRAQLAGGQHDNPMVWTNLGQLLRRRQCHEEALHCYRQAVRLAGAPPAAWFNLGNALLDTGKLTEAEDALQQALAQDPDLFAASMQLARCLARQNRLEEALSRYLSLANHAPGDHSIWLEAGNVQRNLGDPLAAAASYRKAIQCAPDRWGAHASLVRVLEESAAAECAVDLGESNKRKTDDEVNTAYRQALALAPDPWAVHLLIGRARLDRGDMHGALTAFQGQDSHGASPPAARIEAGNVLMCLGRTVEAHREFTLAAGAKEEAILVRLAEVLFPHNLWAEALAVLEQAVRIDPSNAYAYFNLAQGQARSWQMEAALRNLAQAKSLSQDIPDTSPLEALICDKLGDSESAFRIYQRLAAQDDGGASYSSSAAYASLYVESMTAEQVADHHRALFASWALPPAARATAFRGFANAREPECRLRIAYVTADLHHQHPVNIFMQPLLARHDPSGFDVTIYYGGRAYDAQTRQARAHAQHWREVAAMTDESLHRVIREDGIDILIDLAGHTGGNRARLFAQRAAPVQISFLGYPHSTFVPEMDWLIGDPVVTPEGSEHLCSERLLRLPHAVFCFHPEENYPLPAFRADGPIVFGSFNNINKVTRRSLRLWADIMQRLPSSRLLLKAPSFRDALAQRRFRDLMAAHGIDGERVELRGPTGMSDMMAEYADIDIALDPVQYNGGTTTLQALWMGVPVVTLQGVSFVQRMTASFLAQIGRTTWIAQDDAGYVEAAVRLAQDRQALMAEKTGLRARMMASPLWDIDLYARNFEACLRHAWQVYCSTGGMDGLDDMGE